VKPRTEKTDVFKDVGFLAPGPALENAEAQVNGKNS
jgi:hypothetical protein